MAEHWYAVTTCDQCGKVTHRGIGQSTQDTMGWYHLWTWPLRAPEEPFALNEGLEWAFCSFECLREWTNKQGKAG